MGILVVIFLGEIVGGVLAIIFKDKVRLMLCLLILFTRFRDDSDYKLYGVHVCCECHVSVLSVDW